MFSAGKSTFLNFLFGINYLKFGYDITTKSITIIRYKPINNREIYSVKMTEYISRLLDINQLIIEKYILSF